VGRGERSRRLGWPHRRRREATRGERSGRSAGRSGEGRDGAGRLGGSRKVAPVELCALNYMYMTCFACCLLLLLPRPSAVLDPVEETHTQSYE
jgi:hypothetical protein